MNPCSSFRFCSLPVLLLLVLGMSLVFSAQAASPNAEKKVRVSVTRFTDKTASGASGSGTCHAYYLWADRLGDAFADVLVEKLEATNKVEVLERDAIREIYANEVDLINSDDTSVAKGKFQKAKVTLVGAVDGFEYCESGSGAAVNVGRIFGVGDIMPVLKTSSASISVLIRAIDTATGKVLGTARSKQSQSKRSIGLLANIEGIDFAGADFRQTSLGEVIEKTIEEATGRILGKLRI
jgi:curli biogenesis system outer membrane secretion channel CsgG